MATTVDDHPVLKASIVKKEYTTLPLYSSKCVEWKCEACNGVWRESVKKRALFTKCPECEKARGRTAKVCRLDVECGVCYMYDLLVTCPVCDWKCCKTCLETYIFGSGTLGKCMKCDYGLSPSFLVQVYGKKWVVSKASKYYQHRTDLLMERERAKLPECMHLVNAYKRMVEVRKRTDEVHAAISRAITGNEPKEDITGYRDELEALSAESLQLHSTVRVLPCKLRKLPQFIQGCHVEGCKGLVSAESYSCVVCHTGICRECHDPIHSGECNSDTIATIKSMKGNTKPCVKCAVPVYKIDGCDQMWCVACHTAFSWSSGKIETKGIHNPHYFQWLRDKSRGGEIPRDVEPIWPCGELRITQEEMIAAIRAHLHSTPPYWNGPLGIMFAHIGTNEGLLPPEARMEQELRFNRIKYLAGDMKEEEWRDEAIYLYDRCEYQRIGHDLYMGLSTLLVERIEQMYEEMIEINLKIESWSLTHHDKLKILDKYFFQFEALRCQFIEYAVKAFAHIPGKDFYVYSYWWSHITYAKHPKKVQKRRTKE